MLTLPLWFITEHIQPTNPEPTAEHAPGTVLAFSNIEKLVTFKRANSGGQWKMEAADDREGLIILIADLHRREVASFPLNPEKDGSGGEQVALADLVAYAESLSGGAK
jgi:hypothetical protein